MSHFDTKLARTNDEIKLVRHLHQVIKNGLLGRNENYVIGVEPSKKFFSGVLFPDYESFLQQQNKEGEQDPQPIYRSLAKNCNIGLEFLVKPINNEVRLSISGSFNLYIRVLPSFNEQDSYLSALEIGNNDLRISELTELPPDELSPDPEEFENQILTDKKSEDKGLKLLDKYRLYKISFKDIPCVINTAHDDYFDFDLEMYIKDALIEASKWEDIFSIKIEEIHQSGTIPLKTRPSDILEFERWLTSIRSAIPNFPNWSGSVKIETRPYKFNEDRDILKLMVSLVNNTSVPNINNGEKPTGHPLEFYDCNLKVEVVKGIHVPFEFDGAPRDYKHDKTYPVRGINCVGVINNDPLPVFETECIPDHFQRLYRTREDLFINFSDLTDPQSTQIALSNIAVEMRRFLNEWNHYIAARGFGQLKNEREINQCQEEYNEFLSEIESFELGLHSLTQIHDKRLMMAFNLMNEVFKNAGKGKYESWRLFQIVFIVRLLPSLYAREVSQQDIMYEKIIKEPNYADVLWFPTGGGKTEAYLGLIVCALFYDRLRGKKRGCSAWIRFPLRMLSKNQLDRLARILIYAEELRQSNDELVGKGKPFSIGFFAGGGNTPNFINEKAVNKMLSSDVSRKKMMLLHKCPRCSQELELDFDFSRWRIVHKCNNEECFVFKSKELAGILPFYLTDSEIYRFVPSVLCGTVDKLSIVGRYREFSHIFGQIGGVCPKHGFYSDRCIVGSRESTCEEKVSVASKKEGEKVRASIYDPVPSLFIQDELHLLKEELGVLNGHYEGILTEFSRNLVNKPGHIPKIVAATATIESYEHHIKHLYLREPRRYPSMGYILGESFYATSSPEIMRRLYIGILPHSKSQEEVIGRALFLYHKEILKLYRESETVWQKFNFESINSQEDFLKLLAFYDLSVVYVNQKPMGHDIKRRINDTTVPALRTEENQDFDLLSEMLTGENDMDKIVEVIDRIEAEAKGSYSDKLHTLIATSLISHGVDLDRINALFMAGMPSKQAEYIQASSRSARSHAGLVLVCFRPNDLRERSQYQFFKQNHIFMDRLVDPVPINRMSTKAIQRSLPGLLSGLLLSLHSQQHDKTIYNCNEYRKFTAKANVNGGDIQRKLCDQLKRIIGTDSGFFSVTASEKANHFIETYFAELDHVLSMGNGNIKDEEVLNPITSFRDIEEGLPLYASRETTLLLAEESSDYK
ncbi:helicase C-terminal domain-containing protein [Paenibacillus sp. SAFN-117]|uniref:helicase C-terminal domain-containing protein n=1 Tax=Paenibacillus sp. SAFN-117 TaxID=3436860 RepID=UPI003F80DFC5